MAKKPMTARERRIRQMLAYFIYYWGGVIDYDTAAGLYVAANHIFTDTGIVEKFSFMATPKENREILSLFKVVYNLGTKGDSGNNPQFLALEGDRLTCKELPADFYENFFSPKDKKKMDLALRCLVDLEVDFDQEALHRIRTELRSHFKPQPPAEPWEGFDRIALEANAEKLKKERMAKLPPLPSLEK